MMEKLIQTLSDGSQERMANELANYFTKFGNETILKDEMSLKKTLLDRLFTIVRDAKMVNIYPLALQVMRILTRDSSITDSQFDSARVETLLHLAMLVGEEEAFMTENSNSFDAKIVVEAQKCISNLICISPKVQKICSDNSCIEGIMFRLRMHPDPNLPHDVKYFDMVMLFLLTTYCEKLRSKIRNEYHGLIYLMEAIDLILKNNAEFLADNMPNKSKRRSKGSRRGRKSAPVSGTDKVDEIKDDVSEMRIDDTLVAYCLDDWEVNLANQVLKVLFNLTLNIDECNLDEFEEAHFFRLVSILHDLLLCDTKNSDKKEFLQSQIINLLGNLPPKSYDELLSKVSELGKPENPEHEYNEMNMEVIAVLIKFLETRLEDAEKPNAYERLGPILKCLNQAASSYAIIRKYIRYQILPPLKDVSSRPEEGNTLRNKLVRLMTSTDTQIKQLAAHFLFILCKKNVGRLIKYTGYGNAAGLLAFQGLMKCDSSNLDYSSDSDDSDTEEYVKNIEKINPVTGCIQEELVNPLAGMSEEQKEHEAIRIVNAIDQLQRQGIFQPCRIGEDGKPHPIQHVLELQQQYYKQQQRDSDSD